jgi:hypothetical protein
VGKSFVINFHQIQLNDQVKEDKIVREYEYYKKRRKTKRGSHGKPEGKRPSGRCRRKWEDNIKIYLREIGCGGTDRIHLAQDTDQWRAPVNIFKEHYDSIKN